MRRSRGRSRTVRPRDDRRGDSPRRTSFSVPVGHGNLQSRNGGTILMRKQLATSLIFLFGLSFLAPSLSWGQLVAPASHSVSVSELLRYEPTGISLLSP